MHLRSLGLSKIGFAKKKMQNVPMPSVSVKLACSLGVHEVSASKNREADWKNDGHDKFLHSDAGLGTE